MDDISLGNLVCHYAPCYNKKLKIGIVIESKKDNFIVRWLWYNKSFFMDNADPLFNELNQQYLLMDSSHNRKNCEVVLKILNSGL